jgi:hypothetical protein
MRKLLTALLLVVAVSVIPAAAHAGWGVEGSLGQGWQVKPDAKTQPTNIMVAPGFGIVLLRLQLGLVADLGDVENSKFDIGLRPMVTISPPVLPLYARLILSVDNLTHSDYRTVSYGGAVGLSISLAGFGIFAEAGLLPNNKDDEYRWVVEGRAGVSLGF